MIAQLFALILAFFLQSIQAVAGEDITKPLQAEIDRLEAIGHGTITLPAKPMKISDTIHLGRGNRYVTISLVSESEGLPYVARQGCTLEATFADKPIVNVQGQRGCTIKGIQFLGPSSAVQSSVPTPSQDVAAYARHFPQHVNQQFSGISIDAFSGDPPTEPRYSGEYNKRHTSMIQIRDCQFRFLGCGVITKPSGGKGADNQGDYLTCENCHFQFCQWGASINGSQTRQNTFRDCKFWDCFCAVGMAHHGAGLCGNTFLSGGSLDRVGFGVLARQSAWANKISIRSVIGEGIACIADLQGGGAVTKVLIDDCDFRMVNEFHYRFTQHHLRTEGCLLNCRDNIIRTYGSSYRPTFLIRSSTEVQTSANMIRRASPDLKKSPVVAVVPMKSDTIVGGQFRPTYIKQTRIIGRGAKTELPRTFRGTTTLDCKTGEVYAMALLGLDDCEIFRVVDVSRGETTVEILHCGPECRDDAATMARLQRWEYHVWRLE